MSAGEIPKTRIPESKGTHSLGLDQCTQVAFPIRNVKLPTFKKESACFPISHQHWNPSDDFLKLFIVKFSKYKNK